MNRIPDFFVLAKLNAIAIAFALLIPANSVAQQESQSAEWPDSSAVVVDRAVQQADFEQEQIVTRTSTAPNKESHNWMNTNVNPNASEFTQKIKQGAAELFNSDETTGKWATELKRNLAGINFTKVFSSLAIVLGGYFGFVWLMRKFNPGSSNGLPQEVVEVLGQTSFGPKNNLQLVRLGSKLLLLLHGNEGIQTIGEITDPNEAEHLASLCGAKKPRLKAAAIGKSTAQIARTRSVPEQPTNTDLKQILKQLQLVTQQQNSNSIFEA